MRDEDSFIDPTQLKTSRDLVQQTTVNNSAKRLERCSDIQTHTVRQTDILLISCKLPKCLLLS